MYTKIYNIKTFSNKSDSRKAPFPKVSSNQNDITQKPEMNKTNDKKDMAIKLAFI